jgi:photosystem II stability/assembly factor-like uncharacterized protein
MFSSVLQRAFVIAAVAAAAILLTSSVVASGGTARPTGAVSLELQQKQAHELAYLRARRGLPGKKPAALLLKGIRQFQRMPIVSSVRVGRSAHLRRSTSSAGGVVGVQWTSIGPGPLRVHGAPVGVEGVGPVSGEVVDIAIDPRNTTDQVIYIATNDGGIWKTSDGGTTWKPTMDFMPSLSMGAVALDQSNPSIVYAGTGDLHDGLGSYCCLGAFNLKSIGIYRSNDAGDTWTLFNPGGIFTGKGVNKIVAPTANTVLVATNNGLFRSVDGGVSFGNNSPAFNNGSPVLGGYISDLALDTTTANSVLAAVQGSGIFRSTDGGATFGANLWTGTNGAPTAGVGYITFAQSTAPNNQTIYASVEDVRGAGPPAPEPSYPFMGLYTTTDGGANWSLNANPGAVGQGCQCNYDQTVGVDPKDATRVYLGFQNFYASTDSGVNFTLVGGNDIHDDQHALVFSPASHTGVAPAPTRLYVGEDGGFARTNDGGANWTNLNETIATNLLNQIDIGRLNSTANGYTYAPSQDTGVEVHRPTSTGTDWDLETGGDGGAVAVSWQDPQKVYASFNGQLVSSTNSLNAFGIPTATGFPHTGAGGTGCCANVGFFTVDPNNDANLFAANANNLYLSTDSAATFVQMPTFAANVGRIFTTPQDSNTVWVTLSNGTVASSTNALSGATSTWTVHTVNGAPTQGATTLTPTALAIDPTNPQKVVAVYPGFTGLGTTFRTKHVFETTDGGTTWTDISGTDFGDPTQNMPDLPLNSVVIDPDTSPHAIIVASDAGVLRSSDNGATWQRFGLGLPLAQATYLSLDPTASPSLLRVGTYGRSAFELTAATGPLLDVNCDLAFGPVDVGTSTTRQCELFNVGSSDLHITNFARSAGSTDFTISSGPATPVTLQAGEHLDYTIRFGPTSAGDETATFQVSSDDPNQPQRSIPASGTGVSGQIAISGDLNFGTVPRGTSATRSITVHNIGGGTLKLSSVSLLAGDSRFSIVGGAPAPPTVNIPAGDQVAYTVRFAPLSTDGPGTHTRTLRIVSNDPASPTDVVATGQVGVPTFNLSSTNLAFGGVPVDDRTTPHDASLTTTLANQSSCPLCDLTVTALTIGGTNASDFSLVGEPTLPYTIAAGNSLALTVNFNPSLGGVRSATLTITTSDPVTPTLVVTLGGTGLKPAIGLDPSASVGLIFPPTVLDPNCGTVCGSTLPEKITNTGAAELILDQVAFTGPFSGPSATAPPTRLQPGSLLTEQVTFHPTTAPARKVTGNLHIEDSFPFQLPANIVAADVPLCGESVGRGIRVLVVGLNGVPVSNVDMLKLQANGVASPPNINLKNLPLTTIDPPTSCTRIQMQYENQNLSSTDQTAPKSSYYTLTVTVGNKKSTLTFGLKVNEFKLIVVTVGK